MPLAQVLLQVRCEHHQEEASVIHPRWVSGETLCAVGLDKMTIDSLTVRKRMAKNESIRLICEYMNREGISFEPGHIDITNTPPETLEDQMMISDTFCDIERQLPYASRM